MGVGVASLLGPIQQVRGLGPWIGVTVCPSGGADAQRNVAGVHEDYAWVQFFTREKCVRVTLRADGLLAAGTIADPVPSVAVIRNSASP